MKFNLTIDTKQQAAYKQSATKLLAEKLDLKGFRPGKAPLDVAASHLSPETLMQKTVELALDDQYRLYIQKHHLHPISFPHIQPKNVKPDKDWLFEVEIAEQPEVKLGKYQEELKKLTSPKIIVPGKTDAPTPKHEEKLDQALNKLLDICQVEVPELLVTDDVSRQMSALLDQINSIGLTVESYLKSKNLTRDQLKTQLQTTSTKTFKLEFILSAISQDQKITVSQNDLETVISQSQKPNSKPLGETEKTRLKFYLTRQKTLDYLVKLVS